jgi:hypothetical protein
MQSLLLRAANTSWSAISPMLLDKLGLNEREAEGLVERLRMR